MLLITLLLVDESLVDASLVDESLVDESLADESVAGVSTVDIYLMLQSMFTTWNKTCRKTYALIKNCVIVVYHKFIPWV